MKHLIKKEYSLKKLSEKKINYENNPSSDAATLLTFALKLKILSSWHGLLIDLLGLCFDIWKRIKTFDVYICII